MKIRLIKHFDANNNEIPEDERDRVVGDREHITVPLTMIDSARAARDGTYALRDQHGRVCGVGDIAGELRRVGAYEDYKARLANAHRKLDLSGNPPRLPLRDEVLTPPRLPPSEDPNSEMTASRVAYLKYVERISNMWKARNSNSRGRARPAATGISTR